MKIRMRLHKIIYPKLDYVTKNGTKKISHQTSIFNLYSVQRQSRGRYRDGEAKGAGGWARKMKRGE